MKNSLHTFNINGASLAHGVNEAEQFIRESPFENIVIRVIVYPDNLDFSDEENRLICAYLIWKFESEVKSLLGERFYANRCAEDIHNYTFTFFEFSPSYFLSKPSLSSVSQKQFFQPWLDL